jgi:hypothetical protein
MKNPHAVALGRLRPRRRGGQLCARIGPTTELLAKWPHVYHFRHPRIGLTTTGYARSSSLNLKTSNQGEGSDALPHFFMKKYIITLGCALAAQVTFAQANWFTQLFESDAERIRREYLDPMERAVNGGLTDAELKARNAAQFAAEEAYRNSPEGKLQRKLRDIEDKLDRIRSELD